MARFMTSLISASQTIQLKDLVLAIESAIGKSENQSPRGTTWRYAAYICGHFEGEKIARVQSDNEVE
jgi:hypothetical protein